MTREHPGAERASKRPTRRRQPVQARSRATVEFVLEAAARVFRREGFAATTNRIAREAGLSVGSLYEYFANKQALLEALAQQHVELAERGIAAALDRSGSTRELLGELQRAIVASQRFPSQALTLIEHKSELGRSLRLRVDALRAQLLAALTARAAQLDEPELRARAALGAIGELTVRSWYELSDTAEQAAMARQLLAMAAERLGASE